jgi:phage replication-related protein YjqB (UPF0714/DUF867 family)
VYSNHDVGVRHQTQGFDRLGSDVCIIAPHGGKIEKWTSEIATALAGDDYNLYLFEGLKRAKNRDLHITSSRFDEQ